MSLRKLLALSLPLAVVAALAFGAGAAPTGVASVTDDDAKVVQGGQSGCYRFNWEYLNCGGGNCGAPSSCGTTLVAIPAVNGTSYGYAYTLETPCWTCGGYVCSMTYVSTGYACAVPVGEDVP